MTHYTRVGDEMDVALCDALQRSKVYVFAFGTVPSNMSRVRVLARRLVLGPSIVGKRLYVAFTLSPEHNR